MDSRRYRFPETRGDPSLGSITSGCLAALTPTHRMLVDSLVLPGSGETGISKITIPPVDAVSRTRRELGLGQGDRMA